MPVPTGALQLVPRQVITGFPSLPRFPPRPAVPHALTQYGEPSSCCRSRDQARRHPAALSDSVPTLKQSHHLRHIHAPRAASASDSLQRCECNNQKAASGSQQPTSQPPVVVQLNRTLLYTTVSESKMIQRHQYSDQIIASLSSLDGGHKAAQAVRSSTIVLDSRATPCQRELTPGTAQFSSVDRLEHCSVLAGALDSHSFVHLGRLLISY
mgnify:CR=1 FL=1